MITKENVISGVMQCPDDYHAPPMLPPIELVRPHHVTEEIMERYVEQQPNVVIVVIGGGGGGGPTPEEHPSVNKLLTVTG